MLGTGEVVNTNVQVFGAAETICLDENYIYASSNGRIYKLDKTTLNVLQANGVIYNSPFDIKCVGDFIYNLLNLAQILVLSQR